MKRIAAVLGLLFIVAVTSVSASDLFFADVPLRPGVTADIHVLVLENPNHSCRGKTLFAVHGLANTANTWKPLADELFFDNPIGRKVRRILAIHLPGRGGSSLPQGLSFGELTLEDHAQAVIETLKRVRRAGFWPKSIIGHSQGGLIVQMVQQALIDRGSSLRKAFKIKKAFLLASIGPAAVPWFFAYSGAGELAVGQFLNFSPELGTHVTISDANWPYLYFVSNLNDPSTLVPNAPTAAGIAAEEYNGVEPLYAGLQLVGSEPFTRPDVDGGIFDNTGTKLQLVAMSLDGFQPASEQQALYEYLTNDPWLTEFAVVDSPDAVHSMHLSNPQGLLESLVPTDVSLP